MNSDWFNINNWVNLVPVLTSNSQNGYEIKQITSYTLRYGQLYTMFKDDDMGWDTDCLLNNIGNGTATLQLTLANPAIIKLIINSRALSLSYAVYAITSITVQGSTNGSSFANIPVIFNTFGNDLSNSEIIILNNATKYKYYRFIVQSNGSHHGTYAQEHLTLGRWKIMGTT